MPWFSAISSYFCYNPIHSRRQKFPAILYGLYEFHLTREIAQRRRKHSDHLPLVKQLTLEPYLWQTLPESDIALARFPFLHNYVTYNMFEYGLTNLKRPDFCRSTLRGWLISQCRAIMRRRIPTSLVDIALCLPEDCLAEEGLFTALRGLDYRFLLPWKLYLKGDFLLIFDGGIFGELFAELGP